MCVHCQPPTNRRGPPRPPPANGNRTPVALPSETGSDPSSNGGVSFSASVSMPAAMSTDDQTAVASSPSLVSMSSSQGTTQVEVPARPKGCVSFVLFCFVIIVFQVPGASSFNSKLDNL